MFAPPDDSGDGKRAPVVFGDYWRHKKRGTAYQRLGGAEVQSSGPIKDGDVLTIYLDMYGKLWARPVEEFHDGRFEKA